MPTHASLAKIDLHLVRVLHTVITERSVSRAAMRLHSTQPAVSAQLKRLRALTGDALLVRAGAGLSPTEGALQMVDHAARLLQEADQLFGPRRRGAGFDAAQSALQVRVAASDYLDPHFLPRLVVALKRAAPGVTLELQPLSADFDYPRRLAEGEVDLVIGNWLQPPPDLHLGRLMSDEVVCLMARDHPLARAAAGRGWTVERYLDGEHIAPTATHPGARGVIDEHLDRLGLKRRIVVRSSHFGLIPAMVADSLLVLTTGRQFCQRFLDAGLPLRIVRCPVAFPPMVYYQLWHERSHASPALRWLREQVRDVARSLVQASPRAGRERAVA
ncbi:LysR family transcriptional regulator [Aquabacterium sp. J223]|uniref:LysR family transcriptional regulator n=1 Tax=Aquabacterium sp. J223 TaxID=2898431 RepID=UPI0021AE1F09|nr:LysR family transcriptional regulator [Aquabacterium sp. J223]UUX95535.1 LysR family transcriptional regulator [Aquabacterium sp. J223]